MSLNAVAICRRSGVATTLVLFVVLALVGCSSDDQQNAQEGGAGMPPVKVAVKTIKPGTVDVYATYPGRIRGARQVQVRSRVEGVLLKRHYNEGAFVKKGQQLFTIDKKPFQATVDQRKAEVAKANAELKQAQQVWNRVSKLYKASATSEAERDQAQAGLLTARASVKLAKANLEAAQIKLDYTTIEAPINGVTSLQEIDEGALVTPGTQLTTVTQMNPAHVLFSIPAKDAMMREKAVSAMVEGDGATRRATLLLPTGKQYPQAGEVDFTQSTIDPNTGTVRVRAVFDNDKRRLVPGRFVRVKIRLETRKNAIVVPKKALAAGQQATLVYVVTDDNKAKSVPVKLGPLVKGGRIVDHGLKAGDKVITVGLGRVHPRSTVKIVPAKQLALGSNAQQDGDDTDQQGAASDSKAQDSDSSSKQAS